MSYKLSLIKALPSEMKFISAYAFKIGAKLVVDDPDCVGFFKEKNIGGLIELHNLNLQLEEDCNPPENVEIAPGAGVAVKTEESLESKKNGILGLYAWAQKLDQNLYHEIEKVQIENSEGYLYTIVKEEN
jgi:hypothetical protein